MKKKYVYELVNLMGTIEYVGESYNPMGRFKEHTKHTFRPKKGMGKFYGRQDLILNVVKEFDNPKEAFNYQCQLQKEYFGKDDKDIAKENGIKGKEFGYLGWPLPKGGVGDE